MEKWITYFYAFFHQENKGSLELKNAWITPIFYVDEIVEEMWICGENGKYRKA